MDKKIIRLLEMFIRVHQFGVAHSTAFPADSRGKELFGVVAATISAVQGHALAQESGRRSAKEKITLKKLARERLRKSLETINRTAHAISLTEPGVADQFRLPKHVPEQEYLNVGRAFSAYADSLQDKFL